MLQNYITPGPFEHKHYDITSSTKKHDRHCQLSWNSDWEVLYDNPNANQYL
jgi:hypothetical protein